MIPESRLSFSRVFIETSINGEADIDGGAGVGLFVMTCALEPDAPAMRVNDAARYRKPKAGTAAFEFCFAGGV